MRQQHAWLHGLGEVIICTHFKPQDLVQLFCLNGRNVRITLDFEPGKSSGYFYIQRGRVLHAEYGNLKGEEAFFALIHEPNPHLALEEWSAPVEQTLESSWEHLLLESARRQDSFQEEEDFEEIPAQPDSLPAAPPVTASPSPQVLDDPFGDFWKIAQIPPAK